MLTDDRYKKILQILQKENSIRVSNLMKLFNVSIETVRRDLEYLEKEGFLKRVYGGAVLEKVDAKQREFQIREKEFIDEKNEIGDIVSRFIEEDQSIAMDVSTTNLEVARILKRKINSLTILTNSLVIANELSDMEQYTIILTGGILRRAEMSVTGDMCESNISQFHVDLCLISASGISTNVGITDYGFGEVQAKKKMIEISQKVAVVSDSSKFDVVSLLKVCDLNRIDTIFTDSKLNQNILEKYARYDVEIINK